MYKAGYGCLWVYRSHISMLVWRTMNKSYNDISKSGAASIVRYSYPADNGELEGFYRWKTRLEWIIGWFECVKNPHCCTVRW
jgi:hypothetical protein